MKKHKHKWQFKEEFKIPIEVINPKEIKEIRPKIIHCSIIIYKYYNRFACECGKEKEVEII